MDKTLEKKKDSQDMWQRQWRTLIPRRQKTNKICFSILLPKESYKEMVQGVGMWEESTLAWVEEKELKVYGSQSEWIEYTGKNTRNERAS